MTSQAQPRHEFDLSLNPTLAPVGESGMEYLCIVYQDDAKLAALPEAELRDVVRDTIAWVADLERNGRHVLSAGLQSVATAVTVRDRNGTISATDGPFAETKEHFGGFTILRARDLNEAIAIVSRFPATRIGSVEVRPLLKPDVPLNTALDRKLSAAILQCMSESGASIAGPSP